ncbi:MAG: hypothetical protein E2O80_02030 [Betaproteobacteria bacterium]|nr:MAG: hypothetical protein E2O80_02030 [Betaproteobacteria bacterium]
MALVKTPLASLDYGFDWTAWLDGDTINTSTWSESTGVLTLTNESEASGITSVDISGGLKNNVYRVKNSIVTNAGRHDDRDLIIPVRPKTN